MTSTSIAPRTTRTAMWEAWSCLVRVSVDDGDVSAARREVSALMDDVARSADRFDAESDVSRVNAAAGTLVPVSSLCITLVRASLETARRTRGMVDPTVGRHLRAAGYDRDIGDLRHRAPRARHCSPARPPDWTTVRVDPVLRRIGVPRGLALDLGASAKAWTVDQAAARLTSTEGGGVLVEIGGDLAVRGRRDDPWRIRVGELADGPGQIVGLERGAVATSSIQSRRWTTADGPAHHLIDPRTGRPAEGRWRTASVWARDAQQANAASTWAIVDGADAVGRLEAAGHAARLVDRTGAIVEVGRWPGDLR